jgi:hypothetical protein
MTSEKICIVCGTALPVLKRPGNPRKYCSQKCSNYANNHPGDSWSGDMGHIKNLNAESSLTEKWKGDGRTEARAAAKAKLDELRDRAIKELAERSRADAVARGARRFIGKPCPRHVSAERSTRSGRCVYCAREAAAAHEGAPRVCGELRSQERCRSYYMTHRKDMRPRVNGKFVEATEVAPLGPDIALLDPELDA